MDYNNLSTQDGDKIVYMDLAHGQRFWNDPKVPVEGIGWDDKDRIQYLNEELQETLESVNASLSFLKREISYKEIKDGNVLVLHAPSSDYAQKEIEAIQKYLHKGGSVLIVMEADYWTDLAKTNVNEIIEPYSVQFGQQSPDTLAGGYTIKGPVTPKRLKVTYQLGRSINGGTPFAFNSQNNEPFGVFKVLESGGKLILLGDAMSTMYMTEWKGVSDYQCQAYMKSIYSWLLEE
ncbi:MAG: hypothetical protein AAFX87_09045 [Bacteroidota bacterium]